MTEMVTIRIGLMGNPYKVWPCRECGGTPKQTNDKTDYAWYWETWLECDCGNKSKTGNTHSWPKVAIELWNKENELPFDKAFST
jgi:hypothetical protein